MANRSARAPPIVYSGQILGAAGLPVPDAARMIALSLWDRDTAGTELCTIPARSITTSNGWFSITLPDTVASPCGRLFETEPELWVALAVDGTNIARTRACTVPHAVTAERLVLRDATGDDSVTGVGTFCAYTALRMA